jgi:hypothetical protein
MANFEITTNTPPRFEDDFRLIPSAGTTPGNDEQAYCNAVNGFIDVLAQQADADRTSRYPKPPLTVRNNARSAAAASVRADAEKFVNGRNASCDLSAVNAVANGYGATLPTFGCADCDVPRFEGDFDLVVMPGYQPTQDELAFFDSINRACAEFAADKRRDVSGGFTQTVINAREGQRKSAADALRLQIDNFWSGPRSAKDSAESVVLLRGRYQARRDRLTRLLFNVRLTPDVDEPIDDNTDRALAINLFGGLAAPQDKPSPEKQELYVQIHKTHTVIRTVCDRLRDRSQQGLRAWIIGTNAAALKRARKLSNEFLLRLHGIATIGLELEFPELAKLTLAELRNEFFVLEAGRLKNMYVRRLGVWAGAAALLLLAGYMYLHPRQAGWPWFYEHRSFLLAACGAAIGTWTSFSVRQVNFTFEDLVMVEENALDPPIRIMFVIVLTMAACLLFWTGAINLEVGSLKTQPEHFKLAGSVALLIGLFCGLSERALATAIAGRAAAFVKGVGVTN